MGIVKKPKTKKSIETKNKIIQKGFELMCNEGYYNVSSVDIASYAGVSTGIIYQYFTDKNDIFVEGVRDYANRIMFPMLTAIGTKTIDTKSLDKLLSKMMDNFYDIHNDKKRAHEELMAMSHLNEEIGKIFFEEEYNMTNLIADILSKNGYDVPNIDEKVHIMVGMMENFCHEIIYHKHETMNYEAMKKEIINTIIYILNKDRKADEENERTSN